MKIFRRKKHTPSPEVRAAMEAAERSAEQAREDRAEQDRELQESLPLIEALRQRNEANHYDRMLEEWLRTH